MATASYVLVSTVVPVDVAPASVNVAVTDPSGVALPVVTVPAGTAAATVPGITATGTYTYIITTVDSANKPVSNAGVAYPTVTGSFTGTGTTGPGTGSVVSSATVTVA